MESLAKQQTDVQIKTGQEQCPHHWIIDSSEGVISYGKCNLCGTMKEFINDWETAMSMIAKATDNDKVQEWRSYQPKTGPERHFRCSRRSVQ